MFFLCRLVYTSQYWAFVYDWMCLVGKGEGEGGQLWLTCAYTCFLSWLSVLELHCACVEVKCCAIPLSRHKSDESFSSCQQNETNLSQINKDCTDPFLTSCTHHKAVHKQWLNHWHTVTYTLEEKKKTQLFYREILPRQSEWNIPAVLSFLSSFSFQTNHCYISLMVQATVILTLRNQSSHNMFCRVSRRDPNKN